MGWRDRVAKFLAPSLVEAAPWSARDLAFVSKPPDSPEGKDREPTMEQLMAPSIAWAGENGLGLGPATGIKYNPDDLMGRKGFGIYKRMMIDEQVKSVMYFKRSTITGREWMFMLDAEKNGLSDNEAKRRIDIFTEMISRYNGSFTDGLNAIMKSLWQGYSMTEQIFNTFEFDDQTYWGIQELKPKPFDTFYPYIDDKGTVVRWTQRGGFRYQEQTIDLAKFVYYRFNPDFDEHYGGSDLRSAYRAYTSKDIAIRYLNIFMERLAAGFIVAKPAEGHVMVRGSTEWNDLVAIMSNITGKTSILVPAGIDIEVVQSSGGQVGLFKEAIEMYDQQIARGALVPNLLGVTSQGSHGSYSQSDTQFDVFMIIADDEANRLSEALNEQVFGPLARANFADGIAPRFQFKPLNKRKVAQLLTIWQQLVTAMAVQPSEADEAHIREMLEFPDKTDVLVDPVEQQTLDIQQQQADTAEKTAKTAAQDKAAGIDTTQKPKVGDPADGAPNAPVGKGDKSDSNRDKGNRGRSNNARAFARAQRRVAFAVIDAQSGAELQRHGQTIERALASAVASSVKDLQRSDLNEMNVGKFALDGTKTMQLNTQVRRMLKAGMDIGADHARRELDLAKGARFAARRVDMQRLGDMAAEWMKQKAFTISGDLSNGAAREIKNVLVSALKNTWTDREIKERIYTALVDKGYLGSQEAADALSDGDLKKVGQILGEETDVTPARLETTIRTNMFEAINEARLDMFTDPALADFVSGLEYSAILDGRTTDLCASMNGHAWATDRWEEDLRPWVPPNHFNCRSILVPVTVNDDQELDDSLPSEEPAEGFG